jgi:integrase
MWLAIFMTGALGLRCSEALTLKRENIHLEGPMPKITIEGRVPGSKKSPGEVYVRKQHVDTLRGVFRNGVQVQRVRGHKHGKGSLKNISYQEHWVPPAAGFIFLGRAGGRKEHLTYHAVYQQIRRQTTKFAKYLKAKGVPVGPEVTKLRPHSGRATLITELMGEGMCTAMSMKYARHAPDSFKVHLKYGRLTLDDVKAACDKLQSSRPKTKWSEMSTKDLLSAQRGISQELALRVKR